MAVHTSLREAGPPRRRRRGLEVVLILGFALCLLLGLAAIGALWFVSGDDALPPDVSSPFSLLQTEKVLPGLAARRLGGDPSNALVAQAIQAGELPSAAALLLFDTDSSASSRAGLWLQLGRRWLESGETEAAVASFAQAATIASLDVALKSLERGQLFGQIAAGLAEAGATAEADVVARQAVRAVMQAPDLLPAQRAELLKPMLAAVRSLDDAGLAATIDDLLRNPFVESSGILLDDPWPLLVTPIAADEAILSAQAARTLAARNLADRYVVTGGIDTEPERQALAAALIAEGQVRGTWFRSAVAAASTLQQQLGLLEEYRRWLALKWLVAERGLGVSVVPEWEETKPALLGEIAGVTANAQTLMQSLADQQATPLEQNMLRAETAMWLALQQERGLFPGGDRDDLAERIRAAQSELERLGSPVALPVALEKEGALPGFHIQER